ncbi:MAG TPA: hypothetical protein PLV13_01190 [Ilumatobacteraceae bacterium]|nr:hypothetical protein [Ilumatobacteraceae bacterium]
MEQRHWPRSHEELSAGPIKVRVPTVEHVFNAMDPTPLEERTLNWEVADWIEEWAEDIGGDKPLTIEIHLTEGSADSRGEAVASGIHNHFEYREWQVDRQLSKLWREGRISLIIGLFALTGFISLSHLIGSSPNPVLDVVHEGLTVLGWVSMWKPLQIFLYEWWPVRREREACRRLAEADVKFVVTRG